MRGGKEVSEEEPSWVASEDFDEKTRYRIEEEKEPEDLTIESFSLLHPTQKEEKGQAIRRIIELCRMKRDIQPGQ